MKPLRFITPQSGASRTRSSAGWIASVWLAGALLVGGCVYDWPASRIPADGQVGCGNGTIEPPEDCDGIDLSGETCLSLGYGGGALACAANCAFDTTQCVSNAVCGDGIVAPDEGCDDTNTADNDGCDSLCRVEPGWACDGTPSVCTSGCGNEVCHAPAGEDHQTCPADCGWVQLAAGDAHTCGLKADGTAWCWGDNTDGQLGDGTLEPHLIPTRVGDLADLVVIAAGTRHSCAIDAEGHGWCWGDNGQGQLGDGTIVPSSTPVAVVGLEAAETLSAGGHHTCATTSEHQAWCWGDNERGQLGDGSTTGHQVATPVAVGAGLSSARYIAAGGQHTCALRQDDSAWCWGANGQGQLGVGSTGDSPLPLEVDTAGGFGGGSILSAGQQHTCARDNAGVAWCWGDGANRRLGTGFTQDERSPAQVQDLDLVSDISAGGSHGCAVLSAGGAWCWGTGSDGQLGAGSTTAASDPVAVVDATDVTNIVAGGAHTCAIMQDGSAWCWGANDTGQLGNGTTGETHVPAAVNDPY